MELRRSFLLHLQQQHLLPFPPGSVVVEWPRSGEQFMVHFYLLRQTETGYAATLFQTNGRSPWQTGGHVLVARHVVDSLASNHRCFYQGHNHEPLTVTWFTAGSLQATSQYFPSNTFCGTLDGL